MRIPKTALFAAAALSLALALSAGLYLSGPQRASIPATVGQTAGQTDGRPTANAATSTPAQPKQEVPPPPTVQAAAPPVTAAPPVAPAGPAGKAGPNSQSKTPLSGLTIVIDPGHGGAISWNGGATGVTGLQEKSVNLALGLAVEQSLQQLGARVVMTRRADAPASFTGAPDEDPLQATTEIATASGADLFVSLHGNWADSPAAEGIETFYYPGSVQGRRAAAALRDSLAAATGLPARGPTADNLYVLHHHPVPATLLEIGYLSNPQDEALLRTESFRARATAGVVAGIRAYFGR